MKHGGGRARAITAGVLLALMLCLATATAAFAQQDPYSEDPPIVRPDIITRDVDPEPPATPPTVLPFTGGDVTLFLIVGLGAISLGTLVVRRTRHSES